MADTTGSTRVLRPAVAKRSRARRAGESAYGLLLLTKQLLLVAVVLVALTAGVWASWIAADHAAVHQGRGTLTVTRCTHTACTGPFTPDSEDSDDAHPLRHAVLKDVADTRKGDKVAVALRQSGSDEVVRTGTSGMFRACLPLGGALILVAFILAGGLRLRRTAWAAGLLGVGVMVGAFVSAM